jgi:Undecaprenyl-phosphate glucose phosphotransferase
MNDLSTRERSDDFLGWRSHQQKIEHAPLAGSELSPAWAPITVIAGSRSDRAALPSSMSCAQFLVINGCAIVLVSILSAIAYNVAVLKGIGEISTSLGAGTTVAFSFSVLLYGTNSRLRSRFISAAARARAASLSWIGAFLFFLLVTFLLKAGSILSRGATSVFFFMGLATVVVSSVHMPVLLASVRCKVPPKRSGVIILCPRAIAASDAFIQEVFAGIFAAPTIVTFDAQCESTAWLTERAHLVQKVFAIAREAEPGEIYILTSNAPRDRIDNIIQLLHPIPRSVLIVPDGATQFFLRQHTVSIGSQVAVEIQREPFTRLQRTIKRALDILLSVISIVLLAPPLLLIAVGIKLSSPGPIFFKQRRIGYRSQVFKILKFRTMNCLEDGDTINQACKDDHRVTGLGRWLRRFSIDELPQLFNVIRGEMSFVGPRPHAIAHDKLFTELFEHYEIRQHVKPGITGWAQVNGLRGETTTSDRILRRIECDLWYAKNASLLLDLQILVRTIFVVLAQKNAF